MKQGDTHTFIAFYIMSFINWTTIFILVQIIIIIYLYIRAVLLYYYLLFIQNISSIRIG